MKRREIASVDRNTGEILEGVNVSRAISLLEEKGIILRGPKVARSYAFRLNPYFGWKGKVKNLNDYRNKEHDKCTKEQIKNNKSKRIK